VTADQQITYPAPDPGAIDALLTADAAGALPVTGFMDRDGDLWLWSAGRGRWECYPTSTEPTLREADEARVARVYGPLRSIIIHPAEEAPRA
jgi:hypothetical protein